MAGKNPMRYTGGLIGGTWLASLAGDLGHGKFDGAHIVNNFESLDPANTFWAKLYNLYAKVDTEPPRFLHFEKWWGGHFLMNKEEMDWIVQNLFVGNKLSAGEVASFDGKHRVDLRNVRSPIIVFASWGDNITPPQQALDWIPDLYRSVDDIRLNEQTIVYCLHEKIGHLGIFVSAGVAKRETSELVSALELIDTLPPGLYEAIIEDTHPDTPGQDVHRGPLPDPVRAAHDRGHPRARRRPRGRARVRGGGPRLADQPGPLRHLRLAAREGDVERDQRGDAAALEPGAAPALDAVRLQPAGCAVKAMATAVRDNRQPVPPDNPFLEDRARRSKQIEAGARPVSRRARRR